MSRTRHRKHVQMRGSKLHCGRSYNAVCVQCKMKLFIKRVYDGLRCLSCEGINTIRFK